MSRGRAGEAVRGGGTRAPWIGPGGRCVERLELHLSYTCPERCVFCSEAHRMAAFAPYPVTFGRAARVLRTHAARGVRSVHLTGGEPTTHPRFLDVLALARRLGMRTSVGTIGTMLALPDFARSAAPLLDEVIFSLHGPDAATHDGLVGRPGSFEQVVRAMDLCASLAPGLPRLVDSVVVRANLGMLRRTLELADSLGARLVVLSSVSPEGAALDRWEDLAPRIGEVAAALRACPLDGIRAAVRVFGVPMCLLGDRAALSNDLHWDPRVTVEWAARPGRVVMVDSWAWEPRRGRVHMGACEGCGRRPLCPGIWAHYAARWPVAGLEAMP